MNKSIEEILAPKPAARLRIYAYAIADAAHAGHRAKGAPYASPGQRPGLTHRPYEALKGRPNHHRPWAALSGLVPLVRASSQGVALGWHGPPRWGAVSCR